jgi:mRNA-degrading endonuclease RelE of RelBE toxin-antitoxin system
MSTYTVFWKQEAFDSLAELWLEDRSRLADAANQVDRLLSRDPARAGMPLHEGLFSLNIPPLRVIFEIRESDKSVEVQRVSLLV